MQYIPVGMEFYITALTALAMTFVLASCQTEEKPVICSVVNGLQNLYGRDGQDGMIGQKGEPGIPGEMGNPGLKGSLGIPGKAGPQGQKGDQGDTGADGKLGPQGPKGEKGLMGASGAIGPAGSHGTPGAKGEKGALDPFFLNKAKDLENKIAALEKSLAFLQKTYYFQSGAVVSGNKIYVSNGLVGSYDMAQALCQGAQGTLPTPMNSAENAAMFQVVKLKQRFFLGINDKKQEGAFVYLNGNPISYKNWHPKEPNGRRTENCVSIIEPGQWIDLNCDQKNTIVCEFS